MPEAGQQLGRFEIVREIGRGGMAVVYLARQSDLNREVALKQLAAFHATDPAAAARFLQESRITGSLGHPNIVTVHEYLQHDGVPYIAMEYLERGSLRPYVSKMTLAQVAGVLEGVLAALAHAGEQGIVHRDLKPENLMLTRQGTVKVADFGIAKAVNAVSTSYATATGTTVGTPAYMAPEQAMAKGVGPPTDLYAVGVMAYEALVGKVPFTADTPVAVLLQHVNEPLPSPLEIKPDLDPELSAWIESMLAKRPEERPATAADAWDAFEGIVIRLLGPRWRRDARLLTSGAAAVAPPLTPAPFQSVESPATPAPESRPVEPAATPPAAAPVPDSPPLAPAPTGFATFARGADPAAPPAPEAPAERPAPAALAPAPTGFATFARPGAPEAAAPPSAAAPAEAAPAAPVEDGFRTFEPSHPVAPPPPPAAPPAPEPAAAPAPEPAVAAPVLEPTAAAVTTPPQQRTVEGPPEAPEAPPPGGPPSDGGRRRRLMIFGGAGAAAVILIVVLIVAMSGGGGGESEPTPTPTPEPTPTPQKADVILDQRPDLAAAGSSLLLADPRGRLLRLDRGRTAASLADPATPRAVASDGPRVYLADEQSLTVLSAANLRPLAATALSGAVAMTATPGGQVVVASATSGGGRVCLVSAKAALGPCASLDFAPTGLGASDARIFAADGDTGQVVPIDRSGGALTPGAAIPVGPKPHGRLVIDRDRLYVPIERGVVSVDAASGQALGTFATETTPADIFVAPSSGLLFAPLPGSDAVAVINPTQPAAAPRMVPAGPRPAAVAQASSGPVFAVASGDGTLHRIDPNSGTAGRVTPVQGLGGQAPAPTVLRAVSGVASGRTVTMTLALGGGRLAAGDLVVRDRAIADGRAVLELWQGGITSGVSSTDAQGVRVTAGARPGRLLVARVASRAAFESMTARVVDGGQAVAITLTKPPPAQTPSNPSPSDPSPPSNPTPTPTPTPKPPGPIFESG